MDYTKSELMVAAAAREIEDGKVVFVGIGLPNIAVNLAKRLHAPSIKMIYEAGIYGANPMRLPLSIGDPTLITDAISVIPMQKLFMFYLQRGLVDIGFIGGAQIDKFGNLNTTVIGKYDSPKVRLPGSGGACDISILAKETIIIMRHRKNNFVEKLDFVTSIGFYKGGNSREKLGVPGKGPRAVITDMGIFRFHKETKEMYLESLHPGVSIDEIKAMVNWDLKIAKSLKETIPPSEEELKVMRKLDPRRIYLK